MKLLFADRAWEDYLHWQVSDPNTFVRLNELIKECRRTRLRARANLSPCAET